MHAEPNKQLFTREHARTLTRIQITETSPGAIVHDFDVLLSFLLDAPMSLTEATQQPLRSLLPKINARLVHPLQLGLKSPQLKSYPPIMGLYLLLRASGLTYVGGTAKKPLLFLDQALHGDWIALNPTERYGSLLETWLLRASPVIVGEHAWPGAITNYTRWIQLLSWIPDEGAEVIDGLQIEETIRYWLGWYNLGILEQLGFITVSERPVAPGKGLQIDRIHRTSLGDALTALLADKYFGRMDPFAMIHGTGATPQGVVQAVIEPYWPQWKRTLRLPQWTFRQGTHVFDMRLDQVQARLALPAGATVDDLASTILNVLDFDFDHLYEFGYKNRLGAPESVYHPMMEDKPSATHVKIGDLPLNVGQAMTFIYDFGDWWQISLTLVSVDTGMDIAEPTVLAQQGKPPSQYPDYEDEDLYGDEAEEDWE